MSFSKIVGLLVVASLMGSCKKDPEPAGKPPAATTGPAPIIDPVNFDSGSTAINPNETASIDAAVEVLRSTDWTVLVLGLADSSGDAAMNKQLSEERAAAVTAELRARAPKIRPERIVTHAIGERLATGVSQSERKVEFIFFHDEGLPLREVVIRSGVLESDFREKRREAGPDYAPK